MNTCDTCIYWKEYTRQHNMKRCELMERLDPRDKYVSGAGIHVETPDDHGLDVTFLTGPKFGCIQHETYTTTNN